LKEEALDLTVWRTGFGRGCEPVVRQTRRRSTEKLHSNRNVDIYVPLTFLYVVYIKVDVKVKFASVKSLRDPRCARKGVGIYN
jgi:hypothetical protein